MGRLLGAKRVTCQTVDAAHRPHKALWWWEANRKTAVVETANIIGLAMLPHRKFHPFELDTFGLGGVLRAARKRGAKSCLIGIGGSATNDGGFGLAKALGWRFLDQHSHGIERWIDLRRLHAIQPPARGVWKDMNISIAVDVQNRLLGPRGATRVYGPQKGLGLRDFHRAEACLGRLARVARKYFGTDYAALPGSGAAGGLGFGFAAFARADLEAGFELFCEYANLEKRLRSADLVITGEGAIDLSSLMGKGAGQIALKCRDLKIPCIGLAGRVSEGRAILRSFTRVYSLASLASSRQALARPAFWLSRLAQHAACDWG